MATYAESIANMDNDMKFSMFTGAQAHRSTTAAEVKLVVDFFELNFGNCEVTEDGDHDKVTQFCEWAIAGNYGRPPSDEQLRSKYPTWDPKITGIVDDAWSQEGRS